MPRLETQNHPPLTETDNRRPFSPEAARMLVGAVVPSVVHPENKLKPQQKTEFLAKVTTITQEQLPAKEIAALSGENRRQNHATYEDWRAGVKSWYDNKNAADKEQLQQTFTTLGIQADETLHHEQIDTFFDNYLSMSGSEEDYQRRYTSFVQKVVSEFITDGTLNQQALDQRMTLLRPLLGSFGETDIVTLVDAHIQTVGFVSQKEEVKTQQAPEVLTSFDLPLATDNSINGYLKLAEKREIRSEIQPQPEDDDDIELTPELAATDPEKFKDTLFAKLDDLTTYTKKAWHLAEQSDLVSKDEIEIRTDMWEGLSKDRKIIMLGTKVLSSNTENPFFDDSESYEKQMAYKLSHELSDKLFNAFFQQDPEMASILQSVTQLYSQEPKKGLTHVGTIERNVERGPLNQAREDLTELTSMYLIDPGYLKNLLQYLSDDRFEEQREQEKFITISPEDAAKVFAIFDKVVGQKFLGLPPATPDEKNPPPDEETEKQRKSEVMQKFLTPEIARSDPEVFKAMLIENMDLYSKFGKEAIMYALQKGIVKFEDIHINADTWNSSSDSSTGIVLGAADFPIEQSDNIVFENRRFSYQEQVAMRLIHEVCHRLNYTTFKHDPAFSALMEKTFVSRAQTGEGFSALGSQFYYENQGPEVQGRDDLVEMVTMYLTDPEYLARFMNFLISEDPTNKATRQALKLRKIELPTAKNIFNTIDQAVTKGLSGQLDQAEPVAA